MPSMRVGVHAYMCAFVTFVHKPLSLIYEDIFTKFAENVYGYENISVKKFAMILKKQNGCHS